MQKTWTIALILTCLACSLASAADWPQFLGPDRDGVSPEKGLARTWGEAGPKELWTVPVGVGFAGPAIEAGKVYLLDRQGDEKDVLRCFDLNTGKEEWTCAFDAPGVVHKDFPGSRTTPMVDGKYVFAVGPLGNVYCVDKTTHQSVWSKNFTEFESPKPYWGYAQSPVVYKNWVIVAPLGKKVGLIALEKATGNVAWKSDPMGKNDYVSPMIVTIDGADQVVMLSKLDSSKKEDKDKVTIFGLDAGNGKTLWTYDGWTCGIAIPSPTDLGGGRFFITGDYGAGCAAWKVAKEGDTWTAKELFKNKDCMSKLHNAILYADHLYANSGDNGKGLICMNLDGSLAWHTDKAPEFEMGCLIIADGMIYILNGKDGMLTLAEASPAGYKQLAQAQVLKGEKVWAPMALSDGKLVLRDQNQMKCLDVKGK